MIAAEDWRANVRGAYLWRSLSSMHFFAGVLIPFFLGWTGITLPQVMILQAWFFAWIFVLEIPTGAVADRMGRRAALATASACLFLASAIYATGKGLPRALIAEFVWACASAFASGADEAMVYDSLKAAGDERLSKSALARLSSFEIGGIAFAAPVGSLIAARWGLRAPMFAMLIPFALAVPAALLLREPPSGEEVKPSFVEVMTRGVRYFAGHRALRALAFDSVTVWMLCFMTIWLFQPRLGELGAPIAVFGFVTAGMTIAQIAAMNSFSRLERLAGGTRRYLRLSAVIPGLCFLALPFTRSPVATAALMILIPGFGMSRGVLLGNAMNKHIDSAKRATVLSAVGMTRQLTGIVVFPIVGLLTKVSLDWTFAVLGVAVLACAAASSVEEAHLLD